MKKVLISEKNLPKIQSILDDVQKRSRERTITAGSIREACQQIENKLGITKSHMEGITAIVDLNAQDFPRAYKYRAESTHFQIVRGKSAWYLVDVYRDYTRRPAQKYVLSLTDVAKKSIISAHTSFYY